MISQADARLISRAISLQAAVSFIPQRTDQGENAPEQHETDDAMTDMTGTLGRLRGTRRRLSMPLLAKGGGALSLAGPLLLALPVLLAAILGFATYAAHGQDAAIGIAIGAAGFVAMALALILAARPRALEPLFGGLDRMYRAHKWLGITALATMALHDMIQPDFDHAVRETSLGKAASDAGELAFNALLALIALSWFRRLPFTRLQIPYQLWRFSHRFMGVLFAIVAFHQFFVDMPAGVDPALGLLLNVFAIAGLVAWIVTEFIAPRLRRRAFTVERISRHGDSTTVTLRPKGRAMRWRPGQFVFFSAPEAGLAEPHPFTVASAPAPDGRMTLAIRALGGWTRRLPHALCEGMTVRVEGPHGRFDFRKGGARQLWLAGGVGITPFLAWADSLSAEDPHHIHLVYSTRSPEDAIGLEVLRVAAARDPRFSFEVVATTRDGRLTAERLVRSAPFPPGTADLWFCGPAGLRCAVLGGLERLGERPRRVRFEHFDFA
jgi:predicted ferric reductase